MKLFDFNVPLSDYEKYVRREHEKESGESSENDTHIDIHPDVNHCHDPKSEVMTGARERE